MSHLQNAKNKRAIEQMFKGLDDDLLKQALLTAYAGEDPKILEEMQDEHRKHMEKVLAHMELQNAEALVEKGKMVEPVVESEESEENKSHHSSR